MLFAASVGAKHSRKLFLVATINAVLGLIVGFSDLTLTGRGHENYGKAHFLKYEKPTKKAPNAFFVAAPLVRRHRTGSDVCATPRIKMAHSFGQQFSIMDNTIGRIEGWLGLSCKRFFSH